MTSDEFITGLNLSEKYFTDDVKPILGKFFPDMKYSCSLIGPGSEVLGFDDETSRDHHWGPRLILFLSDNYFTDLSSSVDQALRQNLPTTCLGFPTNFSSSDEFGVRLMEPGSSGEINHFIEIVTIKQYFNKLLDINIDDKISNTDWLGFPQQILLSIQSGKIFHDQLGLNDIRDRLNYYPHNIWLYMMASSWQRIGQEEHLAARAMLTGQKIGFSMIASRLAGDIMQLGYLMEKRYAPYSKWLEKAFVELNCSKVLMPCLNEIMFSDYIESRQRSLCRAFELLVSMHNELNITEPIIPECKGWHDRPFKAIHGEKISDRIVNVIDDEELQSRAAKGLTGNIDQISDNVDVLENKIIRRELIRSVFG